MVICKRDKPSGTLSVREINIKQREEYLVSVLKVDKTCDRHQNAHSHNEKYVSETKQSMKNRKK